jgi:hypothetical protein
MCVFQLARTIIMKYDKVNGLNNRNLGFHSLEVRSPKSRHWKNWLSLSPGLVYGHPHVHIEST